MEGASERGQLLHIRACRGEPLTADERVELESWYAESDRDEAALLRHGAEQPQTNEQLRAEIRRRLQELQSAIEDISRMEEANESLRSANEALKQQLVNRGILAAG